MRGAGGGSRRPQQGCSCIAFQLSFLAAAAVAAPAGGHGSAERFGLVLRAVRFYRPDQNRTRVKGLVQIPFSMIQAASGAAGQLNYTVSVRVVDSTGLTLYQQSWRNRARAQGGQRRLHGRDRGLRGGAGQVPARGGGGGFGLRPQGQRRDRCSGALARLTAPPTFWWLRRCAWPPPTTRCRGQGEFRTGNNLVTAAAQVVLTPLRAKVYYLLEAYSDSGQTRHHERRHTGLHRQDQSSRRPRCR